MFPTNSPFNPQQMQISGLETPQPMDETAQRQQAATSDQLVRLLDEAYWAIHDKDYSDALFAIEQAKGIVEDMG